MKAINCVSQLFHLLGLLTGMGIISLTIVPPIQAQTNPNSPNDWSNHDSLDGRGNSLNPMDLIHRSRLGNTRDPKEFADEQDKNITDEAAQFRAKQRELLQQQQSEPPQPSSEIVLPSSP